MRPLLNSGGSGEGGGGEGEGGGGEGEGDATTTAAVIEHVGTIITGEQPLACPAQTETVPLAGAVKLPVPASLIRAPEQMPPLNVAPEISINP